MIDLAGARGGRGERSGRIHSRCIDTPANQRESSDILASRVTGPDPKLAPRTAVSSPARLEVRLMKHVQRIKRPNGSIDLYLRKRGLPHVRLTSPDGSPELEREVAALIAAYEPAKVIAGTLAQAIRNYELQSADFQSLADATKYEYRLIMYELSEDNGHMPVASFSAAFIQRLRDAWARRGHRAANMRLQILRNVLRPALIDNGVDTDPFSLIADVRRPRTLGEPHTLWPAEVVRAVIDRAIAERRFGLARAVVIARYAGARRGDLVAIPRSARQDGTLSYLSGKRRVLVQVPEDPELTRWLDTTPATQPPSAWQAAQDRRNGVTRLPAPTLVYNRSADRYTEDGLGLELRKLITKLQKDGEVAPGAFDFHGLRHTRGVEIALAGCSDAQGAAMLGHGSPSSFSIYRRQADRIRMGADGQAKITALREQARNEKRNERGTEV